MLEGVAEFSYFTPKQVEDPLASRLHASQGWILFRNEEAFDNQSPTFIPNSNCRITEDGTITNNSKSWGYQTVKTGKLNPTPGFPAEIRVTWTGGARISIGVVPQNFDNLADRVGDGIANTWGYSSDSQVVESDVRNKDTADFDGKLVKDVAVTMQLFLREVQMGEVSIKSYELVWKSPDGVLGRATLPYLHLVGGSWERSSWSFAVSLSREGTAIVQPES